MVQATADLFPAPGSPGLRGLFGQKRKRGFSKVEEEPKKAGQTCKEQIPARCERPRSLERSQRIFSKQQPPRINCVCARGGAPAPPSSWQPREPAGWGLASGGGVLRVWKSLLVWRGWGSKDKEGWELPVLLGGRGLGSKALKGHLQPPHPHRFPDGSRPETSSWGARGLRQV